ncbi:MAG: tetratricopeptide repeat protein [Polyangiaceae bacterium]
MAMRSRVLRSLLAGVLFVAAVAPSTRVEAAPTESDQKKDARSAAIAGNDAFAKKQFDKALDYFQRAESIMHAPTHLLMIARSQVELGRLADARETYNTLVREQLPANASTPFKDAQQKAKKELEALEPRVPTVLVNVSDASLPGLTITMDGDPMPTALIGIARPVNPGSHVFKATATDATSEETPLKVEEGAHLTLSLTLKLLPKKDVPPPDPVKGKDPEQTPPKDKEAESSGPSPLLIAGGVVLGVGVVGLGVGGALLGLGYVKRGEADHSYELCGAELCVEGSPGAQHVNELDDDATLKQTAGLIGLIAGGAVGIAGAALIIVSATGSSSKEAAAITPVVGPGYIGVSGTFF